MINVLYQLQITRCRYPQGLKNPSFAPSGAKGYTNVNPCNLALFMKTFSFSLSKFILQVMNKVIYQFLNLLI